MKKITHVALLVALLLCVLTPLEAQAARPMPLTDPIKAEHSKQVRRLQETAKEYGWLFSVQKSAEKPGQKITTHVVIRNLKHNYNVVVTCSFKKGKVATTFKVNGKKRSFKQIKRTLKKQAMPWRND